MSLKKRVQELERKQVDEPITLAMPDGSMRTVRGSRLPDMFFELAQGVIREDTQLVIDSVSDDCSASGNGHMTELVKVTAFARNHQADETEGTTTTIQQFKRRTNDAKNS